MRSRCRWSTIRLRSPTASYCAYFLPLRTTLHSLIAKVPTSARSIARRSSIATRISSGIAKAYIDQLQASKQYSQPIVTEVTPLKAFYPAEAYHQNYLALHPGNPYIVFHDLPKLASLKQDLPTLYVSR